jgi:hypothetical protein
MSVNIHIAGKNSFPCPVGWTVNKAEKRIRSMYRFVGGGIIKNGVATDSDDIMTSDGDYRFINYQELQVAGISVLSRRCIRDITSLSLLYVRRNIQALKRRHKVKCMVLS